MLFEGRILKKEENTHKYEEGRNFARFFFLPELAEEKSSRVGVCTLFGGGGGVFKASRALYV